MTSASGEAEALIDRTLGSVQWSDLRAHVERDALYLVSPELSLRAVALAVAANEAQRVKAWLQRGELRRPSVSEVDAWSRVPTKGFESVIVRPYVFAVEAASESTQERTISVGAS